MPARRKKRNPWKFLIVGAFSIFLITALSVFFIHPTIPTRIGVIIVGDPIIVFSLDIQREAMVALRIPSDTFVPVTRGYGTYPVSSVWKLDAMDKRHGTLLIETLEETVGMPLQFFIVPHGQVTRDQTVEQGIQHAFSFSSCIRTLFQKNRTNIPLWLFVRLSRISRSISVTEMTIFDLDKEAVFRNEKLPDGTTVRTIDAERLGILIGTHAEDAQIRRENFRVMVYNTTGSAGLAQKITRVIEHTGFHVVGIDNNETIHPATCLIKATKDIQETKTVKTLIFLYGCDIERPPEETKSDIEFFVGKEIEKRFLPY